MNIFDMLFDTMVGPAKEKLEKSLLDGMDRCSRVLVVTQLIAKETNIFDSETFADILSQYANKHYEEAKNMDLMDLLEYMKGANNDFEDF